MLTLLLALVAAFGVYVVTKPPLGMPWAIVCAVGAMIVVNLAIGLLVRHKIAKINEAVQSVMEAGQKKLNRTAMSMQRSFGSVKAAQEMLGKVQARSLQEALEVTKRAEVYYKWNLLLKKQITTMQMMLYFQLKDYAMVDRLLPKCLLMDARSVAVKLIRLYKHDDLKLDKFYARKSRKFKGDDIALLASTYAWIMVKKGRIDDAVAALVAARKVTDSQVVQENWERLSNGKVKQFSNAGLGDNWYSLYLEEPKIKPQRVVHRY